MLKSGNFNMHPVEKALSARDARLVRKGEAENKIECVMKLERKAKS